MKHLIVLMLAALLVGCGQTGDRETELRAAVIAVGEKSQPAPAVATSATTAPKHDQGDPSRQTFFRDGRKIELMKGFVNLLPVDLEPCAAALRPLGWLLAPAHAHGGESHGPDPSLVDVSEADGRIWPLGELAVLPGRYCGLRVALVPVASSTAAPNHVDMSGSSLFVQACYYYAYDRQLPDDDPQNERHYCFDLEVPGGSADQVLTLDAPVELDRDRRHVDLQLRLRYDRWLDGLDLEGYPANGTAQEKAAFLDALESSQAHRQQLRENVLAQMHLTQRRGL